MINRFMISVAAAALIAGSGFANAQGTGGREGASSGAGVQQSAPSSEHGATSAAPVNRDSASESKGADKGMKSTQSEQKMPAQGTTNQRAQDDMKAGPKGEKSAQEGNTNSNMKGEKSKSMSSETDNAKGAKDMKAEGREKSDGNMKAEGRQDRNGNMNAESKGAEKSQTTGQAGAGAKLSGEQRTKITSVIREQHVQPVKNVNFSISVGTRVPRDVSYHPLPAEVVTIYPEWRGYDFVLVNEQILVIDPQTFEIVAVIDA
jgi:Protein of unknown function (DUF1236)